MRTITVKGVGTASTPPDYITIFPNITAKSEEYTEAVNAANLRIEALQNAIETVGFAKEDLKTLSYDVHSVYENYSENGVYKQRPAGYACRYQLKLSFDFDNQKLAETLDAVSQSAADAEFSIKFTVKDPEKVNAELLKSAAENARQKAEALCAASGVKLGELVNISYNWGEICFDSASTYSKHERGITPLAAAPEFTPDDVKSSDSATFVWEIT